jgi:sugar transferase (PEP-CTERM system associated)
VIRIFNHYIAKPMVYLITVEAVVLILAIYAGVSIRFLEPDLIHAAPIESPGSRAIVFALLMLALMNAFGLYQREFTDGSGRVVMRLAASFLLGFGVMSLVFYLVPSLFLGRGAFGIALLVGFAGILLTRVIFSKWSDWGLMVPRILVIGTGSRALNLDELAAQGAGLDRKSIVGYLPVKGGQNVIDSSRILHEQLSVVELTEKYGVDEIVVAVRDRRGGVLPMPELLQCKLRGVRVTDVSTFFERERGQVRLDSLNPSWLIFGEGFNNNALRDTVKRLFDLAASSALLIVTLPVMILAAICIRMDSPGTVFYRQERVGQGGRIFRICKFRSMRVDAEEDGKPKWASTRDDRTTRVGRVIRALHIDELPQIFNVFKGEMSFVGPRPERPFFVERLASKIPYYNARHSLKPGITGWAQVRYAYGASLDDAVEKIQYDLYYVKNHSLFLDLMILIETIHVVLWRKGAR